MPVALPVSIGELARDARATVAAHTVTSIMFEVLERPGSIPDFEELRRWVTAWREQAARVAVTGPDPNLPPREEMPGS